jgi:hypothetical protein
MCRRDSRLAERPWSLSSRRFPRRRICGLPRAYELTLDVIDHSVWRERGHPRLNVVGVAGSDVVGNDFGQSMSDIGLHGEFLCIEVVESSVPQKDMDDLLLFRLPGLI